MHSHNDVISICTLSHFFNLRQSNQYILYDLCSPVTIQQSHIFRVNLNQLETAKSVHDVLDANLSHEQQNYIDKRRRMYNFILPFKQQGEVQNLLRQFITNTEHSDNLFVHLSFSELCFHIETQLNLNSQILHSRVKDEQFTNFYQNTAKMIQLLKQDKITEILLISDSQQHLVERFPYLYTTIIEFPFPNEILEGQLYLGNCVNAKNLKALKILGITHVVNATSEIPNYWEQEGLIYLKIPILDLEETKISDYFDSVFVFIYEILQIPNQKVLVHCAQGKSRSACMVVMFLMKLYRWEYNYAMEYVKKRREIININSGFVNQLHAI